jgi:5-methylcytosine-specific restriction endonuclease McrA
VPWANTPADRAHTARTYGAKWRKARLACLRAANWRCQIRLEGCQGAASQVDHIDQAASDPGHRNLRAACKSCHGKVTAQQGGGYRIPANRATADPQPTPRTAW